MGVLALRSYTLRKRGEAADCVSRHGSPGGRGRLDAAPAAAPHAGLIVPCRSYGAVLTGVVRDPNHVRWVAVSRRFGLLTLVAAAAWLGLVLWLLLEPGGPRLSVAVDDLAEAVAALVAAVAAGIACRHSLGRTRAAWVLIGASALAWAGGELIWSYFEIGLGRQLPFPSIADIGFALAVPLAAAGVLTIPTAPSRPKLLLRTILDGLIAGSALLLVSWATVLRTVSASAAENPLAQVLALGYPVGDVAVVTIGLLVLSRTPLAGRAMTLLIAAGFMAIAVSDSMFAYLTALGTFGVGNLLDTGWVAGFLLIALAAAAPRPAAGAAREPAPSRLRATLPYFPVPLGLAVAGWAAVFNGIDLGLWSIALTMVLLAMASLVLAVLDNVELLARSRAAERSARESGERLTQVLAASPVGLFAIDGRGAVILCQGTALESIGIVPAELVGRPILELIKSRADLVEAFSRAMAGEAVQTHVTIREHEFDLGLQPLPGPGGRAGVTGLLLDVTARTEAARVRRESEAKSRFLSTMSHELRTPLNSILGFAQLLTGEQRDPLTQKQARYLANIDKSGSHLLALVNDFLDFSKVTAGQMTVASGSVELGPLLEEVLPEFLPVADAKGIDLAIDAVSGVWVMADRRRLFQVLLNLVSNAIKFTPARGQVRVHVFRHGGAVEVAVVDDGIGIAAEHHEVIFHEFVQIDSSASRDNQGTGLGLALSRQLLTLMGGTVALRSALGAGSTFTVTLVAAEAPDPEQAEMTPAPPARFSLQRARSPLKAGSA